MDFDSVASQLAVTKLFPGTRMVPAHPLGDSIRNFLALHRDVLPVTDLQYVNWDEVRRIFIVDCQRLERLDDRAQQVLAPRLGKIPYTVFDHHRTEELGLLAGASADSISKPVGAAATILVQLLAERNIDLTPFEATILAAGIYEDTGCLTHRGTCAEDAESVAFLLKNGADLSRVMQLIRPRMSTEQLDLFEDLAQAAQTVPLPGVRVTLSAARTTTFVEGLADITSKLLGSTASDAVISIVQMRERIHLVGRSESHQIDLAALARQYGGAGHPGAASAVIKHTNLELLCQEVRDYLISHARPELTAAQIMDSPVRTIRPDLSMEEAGRILLRHSLDGLIVMEDSQLCGVISKRDIDKARHHKLAHAPVRGFMSHPVITVTGDTPLSQLQLLMVRHDIGRLPVLDEEQHLTGLVGRREILTAIYGSSGSRTTDEGILVAHKHTEDARQRLDRYCADTLELYRQIGRQAAQLDCQVFLIGGCVRDLLLDRPNNDLDFVVEGSALALADRLANMENSSFSLVARHERFGTAMLEVQLPTGVRQIDLATARTEYYEYPAALPTVEPSSLEQDLFRRDFTINALAINLHPDSFGQVVDYYNGITDLRSGIIRIMHDFSFIEDPTRIVRAAKFAARLGFKLDERTRRQAQRAIDLGIFDNLGGVRLKEEIRAVLEADSRLTALEILDEAGGGLRFLDSSLSYSRTLRLYVRQAQRLLKRYPQDKPWVVYLGALLAEIEPGRLVDTLNRLQLGEDEKRWLHDAQLVQSAITALERDASNSAVFRTLHGYSDQSLAIAASIAPPGSAARRLIRLYLQELKHIRPSLNGADLLSMGIKQGPSVGRILRELHDEVLDGTVSGIESERQFVKTILKLGAE